MTSGPNIIVKNQGPPHSTNEYKYNIYIFNVCPDLDKAITKVFTDKFNKASKILPNEVKKNLLNPRDLNDNERYAGTDWRVAGDNCITYTFSGIMGGVRSIVNDVENSSFGSRNASNGAYKIVISCIIWRRSKIGDSGIGSICCR